MQNFNTVCKALQKIPSIHQGGCGISALTMCLFLHKRGTFPKVVLLYKDYNEHRYLTNENALNGDSEECAIPAHVAILYRGRIVDCCGDVNLKKYSFIHFCDIDFLRRLINTDGWNPYFDRTVVLGIEKCLNIEVL